MKFQNTTTLGDNLLTISKSIEISGDFNDRLRHKFCGLLLLCVLGC